MSWQEQLRRRAAPRLELLYGPRGGEVAEQVAALAERYADRMPRELGPRSEQPIWSERDAVLICYGDNVHSPGEPPLATLRTFLTRDGLHELLPVVHLLPFFPYSSDDGFSVIDYRRIDPALGDWSDVARLGEKLDLMFDLVLNHCSQHSAYFQGYLAGEEPCERFFIEADQRLDLSQVTRPRSLPLLTPFTTSRGEKFVWTTFSDDQVDLNYAEPAVLLEMLDVFLMFLERGARIVRLDAIAYLWKEIGTNCIHLPQTHQVVKLLRDLVDAIAPRCRILTETNVPHHENVGYLGDGDEAHMIYQFSLAPLLLDAFYQEDAHYLRAWLDGLQPLEAGTTYFNFTASHDGVGVRPAEGLLPKERLHALVEAVHARGGRVNTRRKPDGGDAPYELNISYFDALGWPQDDAGGDESLHVRRFLTSQAIMLALRGIPGVYFHSLCGTPNDYEGLQQAGHNRAINRRKYDLDILDVLLGDPECSQCQVHQGLRRLLRIRQQQPAFHPDAAQEVLHFDQPPVLGFLRIAQDGGQAIAVLANLSSAEQEVNLADHALVRQRGLRFDRDLLTEQTFNTRLPPFATVWLT